MAGASHFLLVGHLSRPLLLASSKYSRIEQRNFALLRLDEDRVANLCGTFDACESKCSLLASVTCRAPRMQVRTTDNYVRGQRVGMPAAL